MLKKIAYVMHWNVFRNDGVVKKIQTQMKFWHPHVEAKAFAITPGTNSTQSPILESETFFYQSFTDRFGAAKKLVAAVADWSPDAIYFRYNPPYHPLQMLFQRTPTVVELNTDDVEEYRLGPPHRYWYNRLTRGQVYRAAAGLISVCHEYKDLAHTQKYQKPSLVIANAVELSDFPQLPAPDNMRPRLVFMGAEDTPWHGLDKIVWLAQQLVEFDFDIIGMDQNALKDAPANLRAHGYLNREAYIDILAQANIALGTLALHRKRGNEASPLKVREYLAVGLPVINAYRDTDFMEGADFILEIPNTENNVQTHLEQIRQFVHEKKYCRVARESIAHIDAVHKEQQRLNFISQFV